MSVNQDVWSPPGSQGHDRAGGTGLLLRNCRSWEEGRHWKDPCEEQQEQGLVPFKHSCEDLKMRQEEGPQLPAVHQGGRGFSWAHTVGGRDRSVGHTLHSALDLRKGDKLWRLSVKLGKGARCGCSGAVGSLGLPLPALRDSGPGGT